MVHALRGHRGRGQITRVHRARELIARQHQLADQVHEMVEQPHVEPHVPALQFGVAQVSGLARGRGIARRELVVGAALLQQAQLREQLAVVALGLRAAHFDAGEDALRGVDDR